MRTTMKKKKSEKTQQHRRTSIHQLKLEFLFSFLVFDISRVEMELCVIEVPKSVL